MLEDWLQYVERTYVNPNSVFPQPLWNVYRRDVNSRTNNYVEGVYCRKNTIILPARVACYCKLLCALLVQFYSFLDSFIAVQY